MQKWVVPALAAAGLVATSCSSGLRNGTDAGRDSGSLGCAEPPPAACGYACQNGVWALTGQSCPTPDSAISGPGEADANTQDAQVRDTAVIPTGGVSGSGGLTATGGVTGIGGTTTGGGGGGAGGAVTTGGATGGGGLTGTGGLSATGGVTGKGGTTASGGVTGTGGSRVTYDAGVGLACADLSGNWTLTGSCLGPRATFNGSFLAGMTQTGCNLAFTQTDEQTASTWTTTGRLESTGRGSLTGTFGFTDSNMCDLTVTAEGWDMVCGSATQQCKLQARKAL
jgi:hypothetical protein